MKGEIFVESRHGEGSVFTVRLPQKRIGETICGEENVRRLREFDFRSTTITKKTHIVHEYMPYGSVLVVDDVKSNLFVARGLLSPYVLQIDAVESGILAIEKIKNGNEYDIIFMYHMMPAIDSVDEKETESYRITVHGMKSVLANIGKMDLSEIAGILEMAAMEKNPAAISKETHSIIDALKSLTEKLGEKLNTTKRSCDSQISKEDSAFLLEKLLALKKACEVIDKKSAKKALNDLKQKNWPRLVNDVLDELSLHILHSDFDKAASLAATSVVVANIIS